MRLDTLLIQFCLASMCIAMFFGPLSFFWCRSLLPAEMGSSLPIPAIVFSRTEIFSWIEVCGTSRSIARDTRTASAVRTTPPVSRAALLAELFVSWSVFLIFHSSRHVDVHTNCHTIQTDHVQTDQKCSSSLSPSTSTFTATCSHATTHLHNKKHPVWCSKTGTVKRTVTQCSTLIVVITTVSLPYARCSRLPITLSKTVMVYLHSFSRHLFGFHFPSVRTVWQSCPRLTHISHARYFRSFLTIPSTTFVSSQRTSFPLRCLTMSTHLKMSHVADLLRFPRAMPRNHCSIIVSSEYVCFDVAVFLSSCQDTSSAPCISPRRLTCPLVMAFLVS